MGKYHTQVGKHSRHLHSFTMIYLYFFIHQKKANGGASPSRCTMFELTHLRKDGTPIDDASDKAIVSPYMSIFVLQYIIFLVGILVC